jgi:hypothetical protein
MTVGKAITNYVAHQRCLGKQFSAASAILTAFRRSIGDIPFREVLPETRWQTSFVLQSHVNGCDRLQCRNACENSEVSSRPTFTPIQS